MSHSRKLFNSWKIQKKEKLALAIEDCQWSENNYILKKMRKRRRKIVFILPNSATSQSIFLSLTRNLCCNMLFISYGQL